jgi:uncharacterized protein (DUF2235 family)
MTNVLRLYYALEYDSARQVTYYRPGIGTKGAPGTITPLAKQVTKILAQAFGYGIDGDILDAYTFINKNFEDGDRIFLFGFSRGAYVVRAVASLLHAFGLVRRGDEPLMGYLINMLINASQFSQAKQQSALLINMFGLRQLRCWFVGVWDTVIETPIHLPFIAQNLSIEIFRQAIAIDERRANFRSNLFRAGAGPSPRDIKQVWFPGVHSDVGGGYEESQSGLAKISLEWMAAEAASNGLILDKNRLDLILGKIGPEFCQGDPGAIIHDSLTTWWWFRELLPGRRFDWARRRYAYYLPLGRHRTIPPGALIHKAAYQRGFDYQQKLPKDAIRVETLQL